jgi:AmmeMemoRadiSam system protein A
VCKGMLKEAEQKFLLQIARSSIEAAVKGKRVGTHSHIPEDLIRPSGAFVTLHRAGELRGCIGYIESVKPLAETVREVAQKAATEDYRFAPVTEDELGSLEIEISVLTPLSPVRDIDQIQVGKHGLVIELGGHRGLLLPQVASELNWDRETFLNQTARKAGLASGQWKSPDARIYIFSAEIFHEQKKK